MFSKGKINRAVADYDFVWQATMKAVRKPADDSVMNNSVWRSVWFSVENLVTASVRRSINSSVSSKLRSYAFKRQN
jgi:hypothetical protein